MFNPSQTTTGITYTTTVALLIVGLVFIPGVMAVSTPFRYQSLMMAIACSGLCTALAWANWIKCSRLSIPSIITRQRPV
jgi:hypothetical protein